MKFRLTWFFQDKKERYNIKPPGVVIAVAGGILLSLLCCEVMVRFLVYYPLDQEYLRFFCFGYRAIEKKYLDADLFWRPVHEFKDAKYSIKKSKDAYRIICIGDSITQGDGGRRGLLPREDTYVYKLEKLLQQKYRTKKIEVINAGSGGYSSLQGVRYLKKKLWKYEPDLVISWFGVNDYFYGLFYPDKEQKVLKKTDKAGSILEKSRLYMLIKNYSLIKHALRNPVVRVPPDDFYENCEQMIKFSREKGFDIVFIAPFQSVPASNMIEYFEGYPDKLKGLSEIYGVKILSLKPYLSGRDLRSIYVDTCHLNGKGAAIVAEAVFNLLQEKWQQI